MILLRKGFILREKCHKLLNCSHVAGGSHCIKGTKANEEPGEIIPIRGKEPRGIRPFDKNGQLRQGLYGFTLRDKCRALSQTRRLRPSGGEHYALAPRRREGNRHRRRIPRAVHAWGAIQSCSD